MNVPMKRKYVDEALKPLFIFGSSSDGLVDVCFEGDVAPAMELPKEIAEKVVEANKKYFEELYNILSE